MGIDNFTARQRFAVREAAELGNDLLMSGQGKDVRQKILGQLKNGPVVI